MTPGRTSRRAARRGLPRDDRRSESRTSHALAGSGVDGAKPGARTHIAIVLVLIAATVAVYGQVARFPFVNIDDNVYVTDNPHVRAGLSGEGLAWAFTTNTEANWHPLTWISLMLDAEIGGGSPRVFHLTNAGLHAGNVILLYGLLFLATRRSWRSAFAAALFAVHPLHVESVAWVAERKDVLSTFFWLLTMIAYVRYADRGGAARYAMVLSLFAMGLMCKPMLVTLPVILALWDHWPLARPDRGEPLRRSRPSTTREAEVRGRRTRVWKHLREKIPLLVLSAASSVVTLIAQGPALGSFHRYPFTARLANAIVACGDYLRMMLWPRGLAVFYPHPRHVPPGWRILVAGAVLGGVTGLVLWQRTRRPYLIVGWLWYLVTLAPVIGIVQVGGQSMADRYTYVPLIGIFLMIAWGAADLLEGPQDESAREADRTGTVPSRSRTAPGPVRPLAVPGLGLKGTVAAAGGAIVLALIVVARGQTSLWGDSVTLFDHTLKVTENNHVAEDLLGAAYFERGQSAEALAHFRESVRIDPEFADAHGNLGAALLKEGRIEEAKAHSREALRLWPNHPRSHTNLGIAFMLQRDLDQATRHLKDALRVDPGFADAHLNLGVVLTEQGHLEEAIQEFSTVLRLNPNDSDARQSLQRAQELQRRGRARENPARR